MKNANLRFVAGSMATSSSSSTCLIRTTMSCLWAFWASMFAVFRRCCTTPPRGTYGWWQLLVVRVRLERLLVVPLYGLGAVDPPVVAIERPVVSSVCWLFTIIYNMARHVSSRVLPKAAGTTALTHVSCFRQKKADGF
jgi:hypothetical protein